jgi:hypothetical protein
MIYDDDVDDADDDDHSADQNDFLMQYFAVLLGVLIEHNCAVTL